jgi:hypothetical protein
MSRTLLLLQRFKPILELLQPDLVLRQTRLRARHNMLGILFAETRLVQQAAGTGDGLLRPFDLLDQPPAFSDQIEIWPGRTSVIMSRQS